MLGFIPDPHPSGIAISLVRDYSGHANIRYLRGGPSQITNDLQGRHPKKNRTRPSLKHGELRMQEVNLRTAKAELSRIIDSAVQGEHVAITRHERKEAVVLSWDDYERLTRVVPSLGWLLTHPPDGIEEVERDRSPQRQAEI
ncbi:type II toxin-antitoxin system Phd/YefM family antitoxin [Xanthobacteraceae bacterium A53D]